MKLYKKYKKKFLKKLRSPKIKKLAYQYYSIRYRFVADPDKIIFINPDKIYGCYLVHPEDEIAFEGQIKGGKWDIQLNSERLKSTKYLGIVERFVEGKKWNDTVLFKEWYHESIENGKIVKGCDNIEDLLKLYNTYYNNLFKEIKSNGGLTLPGENNSINPVYILIYKNGELIYTYDGNHRLYMSMVLEIDNFPVKVLRRHKEWQKKRDLILSEDDSQENNILRRKFQNHPDIIGELNLDINENISENVEQEA